MQVTCPNCGEHVPSDKVNIQKMVAVCPACDTVFAFEPPQEKAKRRKVKQPRHIIVPNTDEAHLSFRTNFRLDQSEAFISAAGLALFFTASTLALAATRHVIISLPLLLPVVALLTVLS